MNTTKKTNHRSHIITLILTLMLLAWGNSAWAFTDIELNFVNVTSLPAKPAGVTSMSGTARRDAHGLDNFEMVFDVDGPVKITFGGCQYAKTNPSVKKGGEILASGSDIDIKTPGCYHDGGVATYIYRGGAAQLTIIGGQYTPYIKVELFDAEGEPETDPAGVYDAIVSNVKQLKSALAHSGTASKQYKIFVKNGEYDLDTDYNTAVSNYVTVIGESRDGVLIKNHPVQEGLNTSATFKVSSNVVLQNLTLQCTVDYNSTTQAERGTALYDNGANNVYRNIRLLGRQDTYYSDGNAQSYFENCEIHGTVDFICGGGNVWFEKCLLLLENRTSGTDVIAAPSTSASKTGYVFNNCTIDNASGANMAGKYYLARAWQQEPRCAFNKTTKNIAYAGPWGSAMNGLTEDKIHFTEDADNEATGSKPVTVTVPAAPANVTLEGTTLSWTAVAGAAAYIVYHNGAYLATTTATSYTVDTPSPAKSAAHRTPASPEYSVAAMSADGVVGDAGAAGGETTPSYTFGIGRNIATAATAETPNILASGQEIIKGTAPTGVTVTQTTTCDYPNSNATMYHGATGNADTYTAANAWRNMLNNQAVNGAFNEGFYGGFKVDIPNGKILNVSQIFGDFVAQKNNYSYKFEVVKNGSILYESTAKAASNIQNCGTNNVATTLNTTEIAALQGLTGTVEFRMPWWIASSAASGAILDFNITATIDDAPARTFTDFKINFRTNPYTVLEPAGGLPSGVTVDGTWHDVQHGYTPTTITIPVDGPVKLTFGSCGQGSNHNATIKDGGGNTLATVDCNNGCDNNTSYDKFVTWVYNSETPTTLTITTPQYIPFFYAEACDLIPEVTVTYYNTDGTIIGHKTVAGGSALAFAYGESNVTVPTGSKFRGWFNKQCTNVASYDGKKVAEGTTLNEDLKLYAVATPIEVATLGSTFTYDLTKDYFYQEDHEGITMTGKYYNNHGWTFVNGETITVPVSGNATVTIGLCNSSTDANVNVSSEGSVGTISPASFSAKGTSDNQPVEIRYEGPETTLTFTFTNRAYIHNVEVKNDAIPESDLAIAPGKDVITLNPNETYQLAKGVDYTTSSTGALTYASNNTELVTVSETGLVTAGTGFGQAKITVTQEGNALFQSGNIEFTVKVVSAHGQTTKPTATVGDDGKVYLLPNAQDPDAKIYYTTDGSDPTDQSTEYTGAIEGLENKVVKAIAYYDDKSPSDIVNVYVKVPVTLRWSGTKFDLTYDDESLRPLFDENTSLQLGTKLENTGSTFSTNDTPSISYARIASKEVNTNRDKDLSLRFNVLMKAGMNFKPSAISFISSRGGTNGGKLDVTFETSDAEAVLFTDVTPNRANNNDSPYDGSGKYHTQYNYSDGELSTLGFSDDASLYIYQKGLNVGSYYYGYDNITITGCISGSEYDGDFYKVAYDIEPEEGGFVVQKPSVASVMAGKQVTFEATPAEGYKFINWTKTSDKSELSTNRTFVRTITEDTYVTANFVKLPLVTFTREGLQYELEGVAPKAQYVDANTYELYIPKNYVFYREGYTMIGWTDGENTYNLNKSYRFDKDVTLKPKFQSNEIDITDTNDKVTVRWDLNHRDRPSESPEINVAYKENDPTNNYGIYTRTATVNGSPLDMKMYILAPGADTKLDNRDGTVPVSAAQINPGTKVTIPAVPGMKVTLKASTGKDSRTLTNRTSSRYTEFTEGTVIPSYFGNDPESNHPTRVDNQTAEYIYDGDATTVTLTFLQITGQGDWGFYEWIEVEYPVLKDVKLANSITGKLEREKNDNAGSVEITAKDPVRGNTGKRYLVDDVVTVTATAKYGYTITGFTCAADNSKLAEQNIADDGKSATVKYTIVDGENLVTAVYARQETKTIRVTTADKSLGDVTLSPIYENFVTRGLDYVEGYYVDGTAIKLVSEAGEGNVLEYWMDNGETWKDGEGNPNHTSASVDMTVSDHGTYTAHFKPGEKGTVIFDLTGSGVDVDPATYSGSKSITPATLAGVRSFNIPTNFTFFKNGYSLTHWVDENDVEYELGQRGSFTSEGQTITLKPVFVANPGTQLNRINNPVIRYDFGSGIFNYDDPTSGEPRKVSAQKVNIPSNTKTFWTSTVYTNILLDGNPHPHWRDVAMWVNTGTKGFVRNGDLPEWASFGPGTTFEIASCSGTKFSLMTYAPISTTTIDGVVPTLDETRSNPAKHEYVYTYTTRNTDDRVKLVIGDDYSYYKWLEAATLAANMVDLHIKTTDNVVGEVTKVVSSDEEKFPSKDLDDGGRSFQKGNKVVVTFYRKFGAEFEKIVDPEKDNLPVLEMLPDNKVRMVRLGNGTDLEVLDRNLDGSWGGGTDHVFKLVVSDVDDAEKAKGYRTKYVVEFEITTHRNLEVQFKQKPTYYVTYNTGTEAVGVAPTAAWVEAGDYYTIGKNQTLYYEGHTLDHWVDLSGNVYNIGTSYQMSPTEPRDMLLYPVFRQNTFSLLDLTEDATATWKLCRGDGAPFISYQRINGIYIAQVSNGVSEIDVKLDLIGENGKIDNKANTERIQINGGSVFRFPVTEGCVIGLNASSASYQIETTKICGKNASNGGYVKGQNVTATYTGEAGEGDVVFADDAKYYTSFSITYKAQTETLIPKLTSVICGTTTFTAEQLTSLKTNGSITLTVDPDLVNNTVPVIAAEATNGEAVIEQATYQTPQATITLKTNGGMTVKAYAVNFQFNKPAVAPVLTAVRVRNATVTGNTATDAPVSGSIELEFDRIMKAADITPVDGTQSLSKVSAMQGKVLTFNYWNLPVDKDITINIPANELEDIYGAEYASAINLTLHTAPTNMPVEHKAFDYVVGYGAVSDINDIIKAVNQNRGTDRMRIFVPDGEYELTGNEISSWSAGDETTDDEGNSFKIPAGGFRYNNHMTVISRANVSLIGQSQDGTILHNHPKYEGIGATATIHATGADDYFEDITFENRYPYSATNFAGRAVAFYDQGNRQVLKNVSLLSHQDTYYSHGNGNYRGYFEDCVVAGTVDWLCGNGDIWLERCGIMVRNRSGNNITAPATYTQWGYVFNNCRVFPEEGATLVTDGSYTLGRPWQGTPAATYLNTTFDVLPTDEGWQAMMEQHVLKFHEYNSMDTYGHPISLGTRTLAGAAPLKGSDDIILTQEAASKYTVENVLGGGEAFDPRIYTQQIDAESGIADDKDKHNTYAWQDDIEIDDDFLQWKNETMALCYFIFKKNDDKWEYIANVAQKEGEEYTSFNLYEYGGGLYCIRAANQRGGLGAATKEVNYVPSTAITLELKELKEGTPQYEQYKGHGWSTICLPFNSKVPKGLTVYAANGTEDFSEKHKATEYKICLKSVEVLNGTDADGNNYGYVVYGPVGTYEFRSSSKASDVVTVLSGNPSSSSIDHGNNNCYVMSNKTTYGLGFYKYTGATLAANRAWLPTDWVDMNSQTDASKAISFFIVNDDDVTTGITNVDRVGDDVIYNLHGQRIQRSQMRRGGVYIINGVKRMYRGK